jgi:hypothetical protein
MRRYRAAGAVAAVAIPLTLGLGGIASAAPSTGSLQQAPAKAANQAAVVTYEVATYTSNIPGAGTDGDVWVRLLGSAGSSNWLYLDNSDDNFERNRTDRFYFTSGNLGRLRGVDVYFNRSGAYADWHLGSVTANGAVFPANRWFKASGTQVSLPRA